MDLNASRLREAIADFPDLQPVLDPQDAETVERPSDPTVVTFLVSEIKGVARAAFDGYTTAFVNNLFYALIVAFACNYLWSLPLAQVVDVSLSFFLVVTGVTIAFNIFGMGLSLGRGEFYAAVYFVLLAVLSGLLPFASVSGFMVYGWFIDGDWTANSTVYQWYVGIFGNGYDWLQAGAGDVLGLMTDTTDSSGAEVRTVDMDRLVQWGQILTALVALADFMLRRMSRAG